MENEIFNPDSNPKIENESPLDEKIREIVIDEIDKKLSNENSFKIKETGKTVTLSQVCRLCHENSPQSDLKGYCKACFDELNTWREKHNLIS